MAHSRLQSAAKEQRGRHSEEPSSKIVLLESRFCPLAPSELLSNYDKLWENPSKLFQPCVRPFSHEHCIFSYSFSFFAYSSGFFAYSWSFLAYSGKCV